MAEAKRTTIDQSEVDRFSALAAEWELCHARYLSMRSNPQALSMLSRLESILNMPKYVELVHPQREQFLVEACLLHAHIMLRTHGQANQAERLLKQGEAVISQLPEELRGPWQGKVLLLWLELDGFHRQPDRAVQRLQALPGLMGLATEDKTTMLMLLDDMHTTASSATQAALDQQCRRLCQTLPATLPGRAALPALAITPEHTMRWNWKLVSDQQDTGSDMELATYWLELLHLGEPVDVERSRAASSSLLRLILKALHQEQAVSTSYLLRQPRSREDAVVHHLYLKLCRRLGMSPYLPLPSP